MTGYFLACPNCASTEQLSTVETITGLAGVEIEQWGDGGTDHRTEHHWSGTTTTVVWDTSTSVGVQRACGWEHLGRDYVEQLVMPEPEPAAPAGSWIVYGNIGGETSGGETSFHRVNRSTGEAWTAEEALAQQEAAEQDDDHSVLALYVVGDLAFYRYGQGLYVCAMARSGPKVFDAFPVDVASEAIVRIFVR